MGARQMIIIRIQLAPITYRQIEIVIQEAD
jgi:hypothetical protein